jgi:hypothetical protein
MSDEVMDELWKIRREYDKEVGGTLEGLFADLERREKLRGVPLVDRSSMKRSAAVTVMQADKVAEPTTPYANK